MLTLKRLALPCALLCATAGYPGCPQTGGIVRQFGYTEVRPPSNLLQPGALIVLTHADPLEARVICGPEASLGPNIRYMRSRTSNGFLRRINNKSFNLDTETLAGLKSREHFKAVQDVKITLSNAHIVELSDDDVLVGMQERSLACRRAVRQRVQQGYTITMVSSALVGDLKMEVTWDHSHGASTDMAHKAMVMQDLSVLFSGDVTSTLSGELISKGLVWGARDDEYLSALSIPYVPTEKFERNTRHIATDKVASLVEDGKIAVTDPDNVPLEIPVAPPHADVH